MAIELPVVLIGSIVAGGWLGWMLDRWLHKEALFTLILGALGFGVGIFELLRRLNREQKREEKDGGSSDGK
jgi:F0F1-type ATP synthase assembly protein I